VYGYRSEFLKGFVNKHKTGFLPQNFVFNGLLDFLSHVESNSIKYVRTCPGEGVGFKNSREHQRVNFTEILTYQN